jgi:hypothetical protein
MSKTNKRSPLTFSANNIPAAPAAVIEQESANAQTNKRANTKTKAGRAGRQFIAAHVPPEAARQFKLLAVQEETTTQDLLVQAINDLFAKHGLSRIA